MVGCLENSILFTSLLNRKQIFEKKNLHKIQLTPLEKYEETIKYKNQKEIVDKNLNKK